MAALGADEYGFGTVAMIATGCIMARVCHTNNCPVGVASQREELRARFPGAPSDVVHFFEFVAEEVRASFRRRGGADLSFISHTLCVPACSWDRQAEGHARARPSLPACRL